MNWFAINFINAKNYMKKLCLLQNYAWKLNMQFYDKLGDVYELLVLWNSVNQ